MKLFILLATLFCYNISIAQAHYRACSEYTVFANRPGDTIVTKQQYFNKYGKIERENIYRVKNINHPDSALDMMLDYVTIFGYVNDTILAIKRTVAAFKDNERINDTMTGTYHYNDKNQLAYVMSAAYGCGGTGCFIDYNNRRWYDSTKTVYKYDEQNRLEEEAVIDIGFNEPTGFQTESEPNFKRYKYNSQGKIASIENLRVSSLEGIDIEEMKKSGYSFGDTTFVSTENFQYDERYYMIIWKGESSMRPTINKSIYLYDKKGNIIHEYINDKDQAVECWEGPIERIYELDPDRRLHAQIDYDWVGTMTKTRLYFYY